MPDFGADARDVFGATAAERRPVVMVHGAFSGGWCFDTFRRPFEAKGFTVDAPDLPGHGLGASSVDVRGKSMRDYARAVIAHVKACAEPPILVGHSMGGLVAQMAATLVEVAALVLLAPSPPWGQPISSPLEAAAAVGLYTQGAYWMDAVQPDWGVCRSYTLDRMPSDEARTIYARMTPESGRALFEVLNWWLDPTMTTIVPADGVRAPVLALTGENDRIHASASVKTIAARLGGTFREVPGMSHWTLGEPGWEGVADTVLTWLDQVGVVRQRAAEPAA